MESSVWPVCSIGTTALLGHYAWMPLSTKASGRSAPSTLPKCFRLIVASKNCLSGRISSTATPFILSSSSAWRIIDCVCWTWLPIKSHLRGQKLSMISWLRSFVCWKHWIYQQIGWDIMEPKPFLRHWLKTGRWFIWIWLATALTITGWRCWHNPSRQMTVSCPWSSTSTISDNNRFVSSTNWQNVWRRWLFTGTSQRMW